MCYLIGDEGSACPTSGSLIVGPDRTALLFFIAGFKAGIKRKEKNNANCNYETELHEISQNAWKYSVCISMFLFPDIPPG